MAVHIGTSGWSYDHWVDVLYPREASSLERLDAYARRFRTVEVNNTFYRWPKDEVFSTWRERLPEGFVVSAKASRGLTQFRKLNDPEAVARADGVGPVPPRREAGRDCSSSSRPTSRSTSTGSTASSASCPRASGRPWSSATRRWDVEETFAVLERHGAAYCVMSGANLPCVLRATAAFVFVRLHGPDHQHLYAGSYSEDDLRWWADRIGEWRSQGRDVFAYFNNDGHGHAVRNALRLRELVGS